MKKIGKRLHTSITISDNVRYLFPEHLSWKHFELFGFDFYFRWPIKGFRFRRFVKIVSVKKRLGVSIESAHNRQESNIVRTIGDTTIILKNEAKTL